jgi:hypothetical protein
LVVHYLYVHGGQEGFYYPSVRSHSSVEELAVRYLECALAQVASLRLKDAPCDIALATNLTNLQTVGRTMRELVDAIARMEVEIVPTEYRHRPGDDSRMYVSSRYVLDAIQSATEGSSPGRHVLMTDLDCIWPDPARVLAALPGDGEIGCIHIPYPPDWDAVGFGDFGVTRLGIGELAQGMGGSAELPPWVGGELLSGTPDSLGSLVAACEEIDARLAAEDRVLPTEEQVLTLGGATGRIRFHDLSRVAARIQTGPRHKAPPNPMALELGLWHLPGEKGLSLRRAATAVRRGHTGQLRRDLSDVRRAARRFNVAGTGLGRRLRDDGWIVAQRARDAVR